MDLIIAGVAYGCVQLRGCLLKRKVFETEIFGFHEEVAQGYPTLSQLLCETAIVCLSCIRYEQAVPLPGSSSSGPVLIVAALVCVQASVATAGSRGIVCERLLKLPGYVPGNTAGK